MDEVFTGNSSIVKWKDNKVLNIASNKFMKNPVKKIKRWSKTQKRHIEVDMPYSIKIYNENMGVLIYLTKWLPSTKFVLGRRNDGGLYLPGQ